MEDNQPEQTLPPQPAETVAAAPPAKKKKKHLPEVLTVRDWKEYLGESLLIIFSVALALGLTEYFTTLHEKQQTKEILHQLKEELVVNKNFAILQYKYHQQIFRNIDSAKKDAAYGRKFLENGEIHFSVIAPKGALLRDLNDVAWQAAKQNNVVSKIDLATYSLLTDIYNNQDRIGKLEDGLGKIILTYESRRPENLQLTLTLIHDAYYAWVVERTPNLINLYQQAIDKLEQY
jgi:hypothetical protein